MKKGGRRFLQLFMNVKHSAAYHGLSVPARCALFELLERYNGINNGFIGLGVCELADALHCSKDTAASALHELDDSGLVRPTKWGIWRGRRATEWRLMFYRCDKSHDLPVSKWPQRDLSPKSGATDPNEKTSPVRSTGKEGRPGGHNARSRPTSRTQVPDSSIDAESLSTAGGTHI